MVFVPETTGIFSPVHRNKAPKGRNQMRRFGFTNGPMRCKWGKVEIGMGVGGMEGNGNMGREKVKGRKGKEKREEGLI